MLNKALQLLLASTAAATMEHAQRAPDPSGQIGIGSFNLTRLGSNWTTAFARPSATRSTPILDGLTLNMAVAEPPAPVLNFSLQANPGPSPPKFESVAMFSLKGSNTGGYTRFCTVQFLLTDNSDVDRGQNDTGDCSSVFSSQCAAGLRSAGVKLCDRSASIPASCKFPNFAQFACKWPFSSFSYSSSMASYEGNESSLTATAEHAGTNLTTLRDDAFALYLTNQVGRPASVPTEDIDRRLFPFFVAAQVATGATITSSTAELKCLRVSAQSVIVNATTTPSASAGVPSPTSSTSSAIAAPTVGGLGREAALGAGAVAMLAAVALY